MISALETDRGKFYAVAVLLCAIFLSFAVFCETSGAELLLVFYSASIALRTGFEKKDAFFVPSKIMQEMRH